MNFFAFKGLLSISQDVTTLAQKAKEGKLQPQEFLVLFSFIFLLHEKQMKL